MSDLTAINLILTKVYPDYTLDQVVDHLSDVIQKEGSKWVLWNKGKTRILGKHTTKEGAIKQELIITVNQQKINDAVIIEGNKVKVDGLVLPLSEYEKDLNIQELEDLEELDITQPVN